MSRGIVYRGYKNAEFDWKNGFLSPATTEREITSRDYYEICKKAQFLHRNNAICGSISRVMVEYVGATGNVIDAPNNQEQQDFVKKWGKSCTVRGDSWDRFRRQRITDMVESGGCLNLFTQKPDRKKGEVGLRLEVIQGGRVCTPDDKIDGETVNGITIWAGIAYNSYGSEVGYYYKDGDSYKYVSKYNDLGMLNAYFERLPDAEKPTSGRTMPLINSVMTQIEMRSQIERNMANWSEKIAINGFGIETPDPQALMNGLGVVDDDGAFDQEEYLGKTIIEGDVKPNLIALLPPGSKGHVMSPSGSADFLPIFKILDRSISSGVGIISTILSGDTDGKNFATSKFEAQTFIRKIENWAKALNYLDEMIIRQVWQEANIRKIANFNTEEVINFGGKADFEGVDPSKSADASGKRIANWTSTKSGEASRLGHDFDNIYKTTISEMVKIRDFAEQNDFKFEQVMAFNQGELNIGIGVGVEKEENEDGN